MISFGFEDSFEDCFKDDFEGFVEGAAFRGLTDTIGRIETFLLAEIEAGTEAEAGAGTRETEIEAEIGVTIAAEIFGTIRKVGTEAGTIRTTEPAGARAGIRVAVGTEALSSYARLNKNSK
jgi:hypothetical protein